jgi:acylphosphatase
MSQPNYKTESIQSTVYFKVTGRVQGVFFRAATKSFADQYGIKGWVRNLSDGNVEGMASGDKTRIILFKEWLARGPDMARVLTLEIIESEMQKFDNFEIC